MKKVLQIVIVLCIAFQGFAQNHETQKKEINKGIVLDEDGNPFPDVKVNIKDTKGETKTNLYGNYSLSASIGEILVFSFKGYESQEIKVLNTNPINISLAVSSLKNGDVVTTALGLERKKDKIAYGYQEVNNTSINRTNNPNVLDILSGRVSGLTVNA